MNIYAIARNAGGANGLREVIRLLLAAGHEVHVFAEAKGIAEPILRAEWEVRQVETIDDVLQKGHPSLLLMSTCSQVGWELVPIFRHHGVSTVALQDNWATGILNAVGEPQRRPDYICVGDYVDAEITLRAWPGYHLSRVKVTGWPAFDKYANYDVGKARMEVREAIGLHEGIPLILYGIDNAEYSGIQCLEVVEALNEIEEDFYLLPKMHPAMAKDAPGQIPLCKAALRELRTGALVKNPPGTEVSSLIAASDVVVSTYSTILVEAAVLRKQNISILREEIEMQSFRKEKNLDESPLVSLGCSAKAENRREIATLLKRALEDDLGLRKAQEETFNLDGGNAERVAQVVIQSRA